MDLKIPSLRVLVYQNGNHDDLVEYLNLSGFKTIDTTSDNILKKIREKNYDICILDHDKTGLPNTPVDITTLVFLRKHNNKVPVMFVSAYYNYSYITEAFKHGADDYVIKPYNLEVLVCRIKALLKRCGTQIRSIDQSYNIGNYIFDTANRTLKLEESEIRLNNKENRILSLLCAYKDELLPKGILLHDLWGDDSYFVKRSLDVYIRHIRMHLNKDDRIKISTVRGAGYTLTIKE